MSILALPDGIGSEDILGAGTSGLAALDPESGRVIKFPLGSAGDDEDRTIPRCEREGQAYERLQVPDRPASILCYHGDYVGSSVKGIWLEYAPNGSMSHYLRKHSLPSELVRLRWARQGLLAVVQALEFCHSRGVLHGDIRFDNFLLDERLDLKLADFTGASTDGSGALSFYNSSHLLPHTLDLPRSDNWSVPIDVRTELFALGSALYEIWTGTTPLTGLESGEKELAFREKRFPLIES